MQFTISGTDMTTVRLSGELTYSDAQEGNGVLQHLRETKIVECTVDMGEVTFVDSSGLRFLLLIYACSRELGYKLAIRNAKGDVANLLNEVKFNDLLNVENARHGGASQ